MAMMAMANQGFIVFLLMLIISFKFGVTVHDQCRIAAPAPAPAPDVIDAG